MRMDKMNKYIEHLMDLVGVDMSMYALCSRLMSIPFHYDEHFITDRNRRDDGEDLRLAYMDGGEDRIPSDVPISVLEVIVALAIRIDLDIMGEPGKRDPGKWFNLMLKNLGIDYMTDRYFDGGKIDMVIERWLDREYDMNGQGSLFPLTKCRLNQRGISIWDQACQYIVENYR